MAASKTRGVTTVSECLRERRVPEEVISRLEEEKIDKDVILLMEDGGLAKYISSYGDRLALLDFCKAQKTLKTQKMGLFEKLRAKLQMRKESDANKTTDKDSVPKSTEEGVLPVTKRRRGKASHRTIEIGWLHCENGQVKQIRAKYGGGTRAVLIGVQCGIDTVLQKGKELFFPNELSTKGHESHFNFEVWDYKQNPVQDDLTFGLIYDTLCMSRLRFYIATFPKKDVEDDGTSDNAVIKVLENSEEINDDDQDVLLLDDVYVVQMRECDAGQERNINFQEENYSLPHEQDDGSLHNNITEVYSMDHPSLTQPDYHGDTSTNLIYDNYSVITMEQESTSNVASESSDLEVTFGPCVSEHEGDEDDTEPYNFDVSLQQSPSTSNVSSDVVQQFSPMSTGVKIITLHHDNCLDEMITAFSDPAVLTQNLIIDRLLPDNTKENGCGSGVLRDVFSSFCQEFYDRCTLGTTVKVPFIRHDFTCDIWKAIGRILLKGYETCKYLPIKLALPLLEDILFGAVQSELLETFLQFVSCQDNEILLKALKDFSSVDKDELLEVLDNYECRRRVAAETLKEVLMEIAHKDLVQKPMYVIDCWREILQSNLILKHDV